MKRKLFLVTGIMLALAVTGISYAASNKAVTSVTVNNSTFASVQPASSTVTGAKGSSDFSIWSPAANTSGSTGSGDLYVIDTNGYSGDIYGTLYLNNAAKLSKDYSYLNLTVKVYGGTTDPTTKATTWSSTPIDSTTAVLSLVNGYVKFEIPSGGSYDKYSVSIDSGSYYCISTTAGSLSPSYYLELK